MSLPTPLLDFFKRGEVARDVRMLAAEGALAPRAYEQLAILVFLLDDPDPEIRGVADQTLSRIPAAALSTFLARSDVSLSLREFFADRGIFPAESAGDVAAEDPLIDTAEPIAEIPSEGAVSKDGVSEDGVSADAVSADADSDDTERRSATQQLNSMTFPQRLKAAIKGTPEMRAILVRDPNKMISAAVLSSPKLTLGEVESFARMSSVGEDVLRIISGNRTWMKKYGIVLGLAKNPKTPLALSLNVLGRLNDRDLSGISVDRNVPEALRIAARKKVVAATSKK